MYYYHRALSWTIQIFKLYPLLAGHGRSLVEHWASSFYILPNSSLIPSPWLPLTEEKVVQCTLHKQDLHFFGEVFPEGHALSHNIDAAHSDTPFMDRFILNRLHGALRSHISSYPVAPDEFTPLALLILDPDGSHLIAKLYHACTALKHANLDGVQKQWEKDLGHPITNKDWALSCRQINLGCPNHLH